MNKFFYKSFLFFLRLVCILGLVTSPILFIYGAIKVAKVQNPEDQFSLDGNLSISEPVDEEVAKLFVVSSIALLPASIISLVLIQRSISRMKNEDETKDDYPYVDRVDSQGQKFVFSPQSQEVLTYFRNRRHEQISLRQLTQTSFAHREGLTSQRAMMAALSPLLDAEKIGETADGDYYLIEPIS